MSFALIHIFHYVSQKVIHIQREIKNVFLHEDANLNAYHGIRVLTNSI